MTVDKQVVPVVKQERAQATVALLLEATMDALEAHGESGVRLDDILVTTGVSRSSLYHHFGDRDGLIDAARVVMFSRWVEADIRDLERALTKAATAADFREAFRRILVASQSPKRRASRLERAYTIGASKARPALAAALATEQRRLSERTETFVLAAQAKGWMQRNLDAAAVAVFIQAVGTGRVVSDIDARPVDPEHWVALLWHIAETSLLNSSAD